MKTARYHLVLIVNRCNEAGRKNYGRKDRRNERMD
jgi:hypothetical protein